MITTVHCICDKRLKFLFPTGLNFVTSSQDFDKTFSKSKVAADIGIIVQAELLWEGNLYFSKFAGLDLVFKIRAEFKQSAPILITSFYPALFEDLENEKLIFSERNNERIFKDPAITFIPFSQLLSLDLPRIRGKFAPPLDQFLFQDLQENLYRKEGFVHNLFHQIFNEIRSFDQGVGARVLQEFLADKIREIEEKVIYPEQIDQDEIIDIFGFQPLTLNDLSEGLQILQDNIIDDLQRDALPQEHIRSEIKIIYISNRLDFRQRMASELLKSNIRCFTANSIQEAIAILGKEYSINTVLCDFRYYDRKLRFKRIQGYHIADQILAASPRLYNFVVLTEFDPSYAPRFFHHQNIIIYSKHLITRPVMGFAKFAQMLIEKDLQLKDAREVLPDFGSAMVLYTEHRNRDDYESIESEISQSTLKLISNILNGKKDGIGGLDNINGKLENKNAKRNLDNFRIKLKGRRIALGLCQLDHKALNCYHPVDRWGVIYSLLQNGSLVVEKRKGAIHAFICRNLLGLRTKDNYYWREAYQLKLTPEEKIWLQQFGAQIEYQELNL